MKDGDCPFGPLEGAWHAVRSWAAQGESLATLRACTKGAQCMVHRDCTTLREKDAKVGEACLLRESAKYVWGEDLAAPPTILESIGSAKRISMSLEQQAPGEVCRSAWFDQGLPREEGEQISVQIRYKTGASMNGKPTTYRTVNLYLVPGGGEVCGYSPVLIGMLHTPAARTTYISSPIDLTGGRIWLPEFWSLAVENHSGYVSDSDPDAFSVDVVAASSIGPCAVATLRLL